MTIEGIRQAGAGDEAAWRELWAAYGRFTGVDFPQPLTDFVWRRICQPESPMQALIAVDASSTMLGFLNFVVHDFTFSERPACVAEDLHVQAEFRGLGIGTRLLASLVALADAEGWSRVYRVALETNIAVRRVFDARFTTADGHVRYSIDLTKARPASIGVERLRIERPLHVKAAPPSPVVNFQVAG